MKIINIVVAPEPASAKTSKKKKERAMLLDKQTNKTRMCSKKLIINFQNSGLAQCLVLTLVVCQAELVQ